jgi:hypothetical protein
MLCQQWAFDQRGIVEVLAHPFREGQMRKIALVVIERKVDPAQSSASSNASVVFPDPEAPAIPNTTGGNDSGAVWPERAESNSITLRLPPSSQSKPPAFPPRQKAAALPAYPSRKLPRG